MLYVLLCVCVSLCLSTSHQLRIIIPNYFTRRYIEVDSLKCVKYPQSLHELLQGEQGWSRIRGCQGNR